MDHSRAGRPIAAAVPVVGTSEFYEQIQVTRALDWYRASEHCHFVPGLIRYANNHELLAMASPKPLMIIAASQDQSFPITGVRRVFEYGKELYLASGTPEKIGFFEDTTAGHGYQQKKREAAYGWFRKWLMGQGDGGPYPEPSTQALPFDALELRCFPPGRNEPSGPGIVAAVQKIADSAKQDRHCFTAHDPTSGCRALAGRTCPAPAHSHGGRSSDSSVLHSRKWARSASGLG